jgi:hydroxyquinol 1,2-dioxygenase
MNFDETTLTDAAVARLNQCTDPRLKEIMSSLIRHLHAFVRDIEPSEAEWFQAIQFLTETGQRCDDKRQEFILLSDTLGVSMLVDAINHRNPAGTTDTTVFGPFFVAGAPEIPHWGNIAEGLPGMPCFVSGTVRDTDGQPVEDVVIDLWQTDGVDGLYDVQTAEGKMFGRGRVKTDREGRYAFRTVKPISYTIPSDGPVGGMLRKMGRHPWRPAHVHTMLQREGYRSITTHLFVKGDQWLQSDAVFGVKDSLIVDFIDHPAGTAPDGGRCDSPFSVAHDDFTMARA